MLKYAFKNIWVGVSRFLIPLYALIGLLIWFDVRRFWNLGLTLREAQAFSAYYTIIDYNILSIILFSVLLPIFFTILKYLLRNRLREKLDTTTRKWKYFTLMLHCLFHLGLLYLYWLSPYMQYLSGYVFDHGSINFLYESKYYAFVNGIAWPLNILAAIVFAIQLVLSLRLSGEDPIRIIKHYNLWLSLADPEGEFYPVNNKRLNFNAGGISPQIKYVSKKVKAKEKIYQEAVPGSRDAAAYLLQLSNNCKSVIYHLLNIDNSDHRLRIEFHTGTSRALELAIARIPRPLKIILSPYEHPSEYEVVKWLSSLNEVELIPINLPATLYHRDWELHEAALGEQLNEIVCNDHYNYVFILSEVYYATGMVVPVSRLMDRYRIIKSKRISFLIDASHSVGNNNKPFGNGRLILDSTDAYIFGSHKWLFSPEPCGVSLLSGDFIHHQNSSYDVWKDDLPVTTVGFARIGSFMSSLELLSDDNRYLSFMELSGLMRDEFVKSISDKFTVVGSSSNQRMSNMIAIKPKDGYRWIKTDEESLSSHLYRLGVNCKVINKEEDSLWLRLTFLYFITYFDIAQLRSKLESSISSY